MRANRFISLTKPRSIDRSLDGHGCSQKSKITEFDLTQDDFYDIEALNSLDVKHYKNLDAYPYIFENDFDVLSWASAMMTESAMGFALLKEAQNAGWAVSLQHLDTGGFHLDIANKVVELDNFNMDAPSLGRSAFYRNTLLCVMAKALRDIWQEERWGAFENNYKPDAVLLLERARTADADSISVLVAWELRNAGYDDVWRHVLAADDGDMARVLMNVLERYPTAPYNGMALAHIFRQWYADEARVDALDHMTLQQMDYVLEENNISFGDKNALAEEFELLSILPDGCTYLKELGDTIIKDPFFNSLNDSVNQSHLFQIVYDTKVTYAHGIPFRDAKLARKFLKA